MNKLHRRRHHSLSLDPLDGGDDGITLLLRRGLPVGSTAVRLFCRRGMTTGIATVAVWSGSATPEPFALRDRRDNYWVDWSRDVGGFENRLG